MQYRAVLFDFDGTLAPSLPLWIDSYHFALHQFGVTLSDAEVLQRCFFRDWVEVAADLGVCSAEELQVQVDIGLKQAFATAELFPLTRPILTHCRAHGLQTALVTSSPRKIVGALLARLALQELFDFVICGDEVQNYKPHPEPVHTALKALERTADEAIMIGDSHADILAGKAAGTRTALYMPDDHTRFHNTEKLRATQPDHIFIDHAELPDLLGLPRLFTTA
ncbi:MAG: HAD family hydrolase [Candidatus Obscuribacterales bacterium]|nr:HAD family hydrolase [Steroidobacteraceae bacterium]